MKHKFPSPIYLFSLSLLQPTLSGVHLFSALPPLFVHIHVLPYKETASCPPLTAEGAIALGLPAKLMVPAATSLAAMKANILEEINNPKLSTAEGDACRNHIVLEVVRLAKISPPYQSIPLHIPDDEALKELLNAREKAYQSKAVAPELVAYVVDCSTQKSLQLPEHAVYSNTRPSRGWLLPLSGAVGLYWVQRSRNFIRSLPPSPPQTQPPAQKKMEKVKPSSSEHIRPVD